MKDEKRTHELFLGREVSQAEGKLLDIVNEALYIVFGEDCIIDWRDDRTVEITTSVGVNRRL